MKLFRKIPTIKRFSKTERAQLAPNTVDENTPAPWRITVNFQNTSNILQTFTENKRGSRGSSYRRNQKNRKQNGFQFSSVQSLSRVRLFATPWIAAHQASLSITNSRSSLKLMSIESVMPSSHLILCHPLLLLSPIPPSIRVFSSELTLHMRWPKYWSFSFSISPSKEHPGMISFKMDWLDLLAIQGTLKSLIQHHSSKAS